MNEILTIIQKAGLSKNHMRAIYMSNGDYEMYLKSFKDPTPAFRYEAPYRYDDYMKLNGWIQGWW